MITVTKKDECHILIDTDPSTAKEIVEFFTFEVPGAKFMPAYRNRMWDGKARMFNMYTRELYVGLLDYLVEFCEQLEYKIDIQIDKVGEDGTIDQVSKFTESLNLHSQGKKIAIRDYQLDAVTHAINNGRSLLLSPTASGKSLIIYSLLRYHQAHGRKQLIIVPTTSLVEQMWGDFNDYSSEDKWQANKFCHKIYGGKDKTNKAAVVISTWQSIYKFPKSWFEEFDVVYGDEAHNFKAKSLTTLLDKMVNTPYRYGTTGTLDGTKTHKLVLEGLFGRIYNVTTTKKLQDDNTLAPLDIKVLLLKYPEDVRKAWGKKDYHAELDFIVKNEARNRLITNLALDQNGNTLVLFQYVEKHGKVLYELIKNKAHSKRKIFFVSGEVDTNDREAIRQIVETQKNAIIVASLGTFSTGINIRNLHNIVFASPSKSQVKVLQSIGRGLRNSDDGSTTQLYDIADDLHWKSRKNYTLLHSAERVKIYARESFKHKIYEVELKQ